MTRSRRGFSTVEVCVTLLVAVLLLAATYGMLHLMVRGEQAMDRDGTRALAEARMMETLLLDLRSSVSVEVTGPEGYRITRVRASPGAFALQTVTWRVAKARVRRDDGERVTEFDFTGLLDPREPVFRFHVEKVSDAKFQS